MVVYHKSEQFDYSVGFQRLNDEGEEVGRGRL